LTEQSAEIIRGVTRVNEPRRIVERVSVPMLDGAGVPVARLLLGLISSLLEIGKLEAG
jgi:hypothetical protein